MYGIYIFHYLRPDNDLHYLPIKHGSPPGNTDEVILCIDALVLT